MNLNKAVTYDNDILTVTLDYSMKGGEVDWARRGEEGFAQRWQVQSKKYTRANTTGWYTFRFQYSRRFKCSTNQSGANNL